MDKEEMLYKKMEREQKEFREQLLSMEPKEILNNSSEYWVREDILREMEYVVLSPEQVDVLYDLENPLKSIHEKFCKMDTDHMVNIQNSIRYKADDIINANKSEQLITALRNNHKKLR